MFRFCLIIFQFCGLYPIKVDFFERAFGSPPRESILLILWPCFHMALISLFIIFVAIKQDEMLYAETPIGKLNDILVYFSLLVAHMSSVIEVLVKRKYYKSFWDNFSRVLKLNKKSKSIKVSEWSKMIFVKVVVCLLFSIIIEILVILNISEDEQWTKFWFVSVYSLMMTRVLHLQHIFFIDFIYNTLQDMNLHLKHIIAWSKAVGEDKEISRRFLYNSLSQTKEKFKNLMDMLICVNRIFCWCQVLNVGQNFIEVTSELYWIYAFSKEPKFLWRKSTQIIKLNSNMLVLLQQR